MTRKARTQQQHSFPMQVEIRCKLQPFEMRVKLDDNLFVKRFNVIVAYPTLVFVVVCLVEKMKNEQKRKAAEKKKIVEKMKEERRKKAVRHTLFFILSYLSYLSW